MKNTVKLIISILIIGYLIYIIDINLIIQTIELLDKAYIIPTFMLVILSCLIGTFSLYLITKPIKTDIKIKDISHIYFNSWALGQLLPSKIGELTRIYFLKDKGIDLKNSTLIFLIDKIISIICLAIITLLSINTFTKINTVINIIVITGFIVVSTVIIFNKKIRNLILKIIPKKLREKYTDNFSIRLSEYITENKKLIIGNFLLNFFRLTIDALTIIVLFKSLNISIGIWPILGVNAITTISSIIPITISGLGVRELIAVFLLQTIGIPKEISFVVYLIMTTTRIIISATITVLYISKEGIGAIKSRMN